MSLEATLLRLCEAIEANTAANTAAVTTIIGTAARMPTTTEAPAAEAKTKPAKVTAKVTAKALVPPAEPDSTPEAPATVLPPTTLTVVDPELGEDDDASAETVTVEDLRAYIRPRNKDAAFKAKFADLRTEFGVSELSGLTEEQLGPFFAAIKKL
jgi:hypothetical protein